MKIIYILLLMLLSIPIYSQNNFKCNIFVQQPGMYYSSENITSAGFGFGSGIALEYNKNLISQADMNIYWMNGNALSTRFAAGYKLNGVWSPTVMLTYSILWGSRTEILYSDGSRPERFVNTYGIRIAPLRFENENGFVSLLEFGFGIGPYNGLNIEISTLSLGIVF